MYYKNLVIAAALPIFFACTNDNDNVSDNPTGQTVEFVAGLDASSRTTLSGLNVMWNVGDKIKVNGTSSDAAKQLSPSTAALTAASQYARFTVSNLTNNPDGPYYCIYPDGLSTGTGPTYTYTLPATQYYVSGTTYSNNAISNGYGINPSVAYKADAWTPNSTTPIYFYNLCGIAKVTVTGKASVRKVRLIAAGANEYVSGTATVTVNTGSNATFTMTSGSTTVDIDFGSAINLTSDSRTIHFILPPRTYTKGLTVQLLNASNTVLGSESTRADFTITRGVITDFGELNFPITPAGSNIYMSSEGYLTFASPTDDTKQLYQGLYFRWGSLVGLSAYYTIDGTAYSLNTNIIIYYPTSMTASTANWTTGKLSGSNPWSGTQLSDVPQVTPVTATTADDCLGTTFTGYKGDICKFLSANGRGRVPPGVWRTPTGDEWISLGFDISGSDGSMPTVTNAEGTTIIPNYITRSGATARIPKSSFSYRVTNGTQTMFASGSVGYNLRYATSSSTSDAGYGTVVYATGGSSFFSENVITGTNTPSAVPVRCVKN